MRHTAGRLLDGLFNRKGKWKNRNRWIDRQQQDRQVSGLAGGHSGRPYPRTREIAGKVSRKTVYIITSLAREQASPAARLAFNRQHWLIQDDLHWRRDTGFGEDAGHIRDGNGRQALAALRNTVLRMLLPFPP